MERPIKILEITSEALTSFQNIIYEYYHAQGRNLPWRETDNPYYILVSEMMLQQTQVARVMGKYPLFIKTFPDIFSLSRASVKAVVGVWQGLGYNRRAISLQKAAHIIVKDFKGRIPSDVEILRTLPGIGEATASAICAFAYNKPVVFIETNIRSVFTHFFFREQDKVSDREIAPLIEKTLDIDYPRMWYYALMDYGVMLKKEHKNINKKSTHYRKQPPFHGSNRQIRGMILRTLIASPLLSEDELADILKKDQTKIKNTITQLREEGFVKEERGKYSIP
ncbi:MAG: A/G-specific adenine glycosylase [bacterium]